MKYFINDRKKKIQSRIEKKILLIMKNNLSFLFLFLLIVLSNALVSVRTTMSVPSASRCPIDRGAQETDVEDVATTEEPKRSRGP